MDKILFLIASMFFNYESQLLSDSVLEFNYDASRTQIRESYKMAPAVPPSIKVDAQKIGSIADNITRNEFQLKISVSNLNYSSERDSIRFHIVQENVSSTLAKDTISYQFLIVKDPKLINRAKLLYLNYNGTEYNDYGTIDSCANWSKDLTIIDNDTLKIAYIKGCAFIENNGIIKWTDYSISSGGMAGYGYNVYTYDTLMLQNYNGPLFIGPIKNNYQVNIKVKTETYGGKYGPSNCVMMWIQKSDKTFVKTILKAVKTRFESLQLWNSVSTDKEAVINGVTGATRTSHNDTLSVFWDCTDRNGTAVRDGIYEFWVEMSESTGTSKSSFGSIKIDSYSKKVNGQTNDIFPYFKAEYISMSNKNALNTHVEKTLQKGIRFIPGNNSLVFLLPNSSDYSVTLLTPLGRKVVTVKGKGSKVQLPIAQVHLKPGVYIARISQSGNNYSLPYLKSF